MDPEEVSALARKNETLGNDMLAAFQAFREWMEGAPKRWEGALLIEKLDSITDGLASRAGGDRAWVCCSQDVQGMHSFSPIEVREGEEGWEMAKSMEKKGYLCVPAGLFWETFERLAARIREGQVSGEESEASGLLVRELKLEFDRHTTTGLGPLPDHQ